MKTQKILKTTLIVGMFVIMLCMFVGILVLSTDVQVADADATGNLSIDMTVNPSKIITTHSKNSQFKLDLHLHNTLNRSINMITLNLTFNKDFFEPVILTDEWGGTSPDVTKGTEFPILATTYNKVNNYVKLQISAESPQKEIKSASKFLLASVNFKIKADVTLIAADYAFGIEETEVISAYSNKISSTENQVTGDAMIVEPLDISSANINVRAPSNVKTIKSLTVKDEKNNTLDHGSLSGDTYTVATPVPYTTKSVTVSATANDNGTVKIGNPHKAKQDLKVGDNTIKLTVTAEDETTKLYYVKITRTAAKTSTAISTFTVKVNNESKILTVGSDRTYTITVPYADRGKVKVNVVLPSGDFSTMTIAGGNINSGSDKPLTLSDSTNTIKIAVKSQAGTTVTYDLVINVSPALVEINTLSVGGTTLTLGDNKTFTAVDVPFTTTSVNIVATAKHLGTVKIGTNNNASQSLDVGDNTFVVLITGADGVASNAVTYYVKIKRILGETSMNITDLTVKLDGLNIETTMTDETYTVINSIPYASRNNITLNITLGSDVATMTIDSTAINSGDDRTLSLNIGANSIEIIVTSQGGESATYNLVINVVEAVTGSGLATLVIKDSNGNVIDLYPEFDSKDKMYALVLGGIKTITIEATLYDPTARITEGIGEFTVATMSLFHYIKVTPQSGEEIIYTFMINKDSETPMELSSIKINDIEITIVPDVFEYDVTLSGNATEFEYSYEQMFANSEVEVFGDTGLLSPGKNTLVFLVTAINGTKEVYTITTTVEMPEEFNMIIFYVVCSLAGVFFVIVLILIVLLIKKKKKKKGDDKNNYDDFKKSPPPSIEQPNPSPTSVMEKKTVDEQDNE